MRTHLRTITHVDGSKNYDLVIDNATHIDLGIHPHINSAEQAAHDISKFIGRNSAEIIDYRGCIENIRY